MCIFRNRSEGANVLNYLIILNDGNITLNARHYSKSVIPPNCDKNKIMGFDYSKLTPAHSRAARGLLGWTQEDLETQSSVSRKTIQNFEGGSDVKVMSRTLRDICEAFEKAGIEFTNGDEPGVKLLKVGG